MFIEKNSESSRFLLHFSLAFLIHERTEISKGADYEKKIYSKSDVSDQNVQAIFSKFTHTQDHHSSSLKELLFLVMIFAQSIFCLINKNKVKLTTNENSNFDKFYAG